MKNKNLIVTVIFDETDLISKQNIRNKYKIKISNETTEFNY